MRSQKACPPQPLSGNRTTLQRVGQVLYRSLASIKDGHLPVKHRREHHNHSSILRDFAARRSVQCLSDLTIRQPSGFGLNAWRSLTGLTYAIQRHRAALAAAANAPSQSVRAVANCRDDHVGQEHSVYGRLQNTTHRPERPRRVMWRRPCPASHCAVMRPKEPRPPVTIQRPCCRGGRGSRANSSCMASVEPTKLSLTTPSGAGCTGSCRAVL